MGQIQNSTAVDTARPRDLSAMTRAFEASCPSPISMSVATVDLAFMTPV
jgi:hypothetical protein